MKFWINLHNFYFYLTCLDRKKIKIDVVEVRNENIGEVEVDQEAQVRIAGDMKENRQRKEKQEKKKWKSNVYVKLL